MDFSNGQEFDVNVEEFIINDNAGRFLDPWKKEVLSQILEIQKMEFRQKTEEKKADLQTEINTKRNKLNYLENTNNIQEILQQDREGSKKWTTEMTKIHDNNMTRVYGNLDRESSKLSKASGELGRLLPKVAELIRLEKRIGVVERKNRLMKDQLAKNQGRTMSSQGNPKVEKMKVEIVQLKTNIQALVVQQDQNRHQEPTKKRGRPRKDIKEELP